MTYFFDVPSPDLRGILKGAQTSKQVKYSVSYAYNGGTVIDGKWYAGYRVGKPIIDSDCELVDIAVGLQFNCHPPYATMLLRRRKSI